MVCCGAILRCAALAVRASRALPACDSVRSKEELQNRLRRKAKLEDELNMQPNVEGDDDDIPRLSAETLAALAAFRSEHEQRLKDEDRQQATELQEPDNFEEDWNLSQFWYDEDTSKLMAKEALEHCNGGPIACLCTPSIFRGLKRVAPATAPAYYLFEYDRRFRCYGERFIFYDFNHPENLSADLKGKFKFIFMDPPFLSEECFTETPGLSAAPSISHHTAAKAVEFLRAPDARFVVLTGAVMERHIKRLFPDVHTCKYKPHHKRNLQNEFFCCSNYTSAILGEEKRS